MDEKWDLIYKCVKRERNSMLIGMFFIGLVGVGASYGGFFSDESSIGLGIFGLFCFAISVFGFIKIVKPIWDPEDAPVVHLLKDNPENVHRIYCENISSGAYGVSRTIHKVNLIDKEMNSYALGVKGTLLDELMDFLTGLSPEAKVGYEPEEIQAEAKEWAEKKKAKKEADD